jgi:type II restriction/modification system DNA methylase subunit YeeA
LFERFLDPDKRAQIGAHYTDPDKIMMIVEPVVARPLRREWETAKAEIEAIMAPALAASAGNGKAASQNLAKRFEAARAKAELRRDAFIDRLCALRILDPACGSGNFLYLALQAVKDIEYRAILECETLGLGMIVPRVGPEILHGIEINPFAAELARTTIWIGDIQWRVKNAITHHPRPILRKLDAIECRDALLTADGKGSYVEAQWPEADFIIGNPPFLGTKKMISGLGAKEARTVRAVYEERISPFSDLVCWWFEKARAQVVAGKAKRVGLVATNSIRGGKNRLVLDAITRDLAIFEAWSDEPWTVDGAAVRVSLVCFSSCAEPASLDGRPVDSIHSDLTTGSDLPKAARLIENSDASFIGAQKSGPFDVSGAKARQWLIESLNVNGRPNSDVLRPYSNGIDVARRGRDKWLIDFGDRDEKEIAHYESPFEYAQTTVKPFRETSAIKDFDWWRLWRTRPELARASEKLARTIVTPEVTKHRVFVWMDKATGADKNLTVIARDDDTTFGILHSASTKRGRCGSAHGSASATIRATPQPPPSRPSPSPPA